MEPQILVFKSTRHVRIFTPLVEWCCPSRGMSLRSAGRRTSVTWPIAKRDSHADTENGWFDWFAAPDRTVGTSWEITSHIPPLVWIYIEMSGGCVDYCCGGDGKELLFVSCLVTGASWLFRLQIYLPPMLEGVTFYVTNRYPRIMKRGG